MSTAQEVGVSYACFIGFHWACLLKGIKPFTKSWDNYLMLTRGCNHRNKVYGENYCRICGRKLTNSKSIDRAIGPVCWHHSQKARANMIIAKEIREREVH